MKILTLWGTEYQLGLGRSVKLSKSFEDLENKVYYIEFPKWKSSFDHPKIDINKGT